MRLFIILTVLCFTAACDQGGSAVTDEFAYCNDRSDSLAKYAQCRCRTITGSKSMTPEMDQCLTNPKVYAEGYKGEIPERMRNKMN